ncbi:putative WD40 domain containing protein [Senna tora]|uniref:Putative WD40 domain containing protein n=1 Tax=Senna tora TaxID=362788 RepID=A0A834WGR8_9FABA|nr:putative WD40 domain containing protein [Senna tora]
MKSCCSRDFVLYVGGLVWALDWCPQIHLDPGSSFKCEFLAVAAHPPGASYHKMGAPLTGRGVIQIWCLLNSSGNNDVCPPSQNRKRGRKTSGATDDKSTQIKRPRGRPRKNPLELAVVDMNCETPLSQALKTSDKLIALDGVIENNEEVSPTEKNKRGLDKSGTTSDKLTQIKKPRGRPRKNSKNVAVFDLNCEIQQEQSLAVHFPVDSTEFHSAVGVSSNHEEYALQQDSGTMRKCSNKAASTCNTMLKTPVQRSSLRTNCRGGKYNHDGSPPLLTQCEDDSNHQLIHISEVDPLTAPCSNPEDVDLPRMVMCLAHNGKVAWDVKWRPCNTSDSVFKHRMGYLAVLLGSGSLEVWEVPLPRALRAIYQHEESTDPRFIKLEPVFKCSMIKRGGLQRYSYSCALSDSIPLTVEWSVTPPHDYLLAGCHDGTVALWKFSTTASSRCYGNILTLDLVCWDGSTRRNTKPLLCFGGDTVPIRAVAWAPFEGDPENSNIILTAGHEGLKFWDLRDPFRPLRKLQPVPRIIYSLDWLSHPSCIIMSFEDGTMRTLSLVKAANDLPISGKKSSGKKQPGLHGFSCSSFAIWSVHVSRITGMVAYCSADGAVLRFQLTTKAVETDHSRHRVPHVFCGSLTEEESTLTINTSGSNTPFPFKKTPDKGRPSSFRGFVFESYLSKSKNNQMTKDPDSRALALCDGDDLGLESGLEEASASTERPQKPKAGGSNKKKQADSQALVCRDDETAGAPEGDNEMSNLGSVPEAFPPKMVALHRVRWNMNEGSERWLCYGGAGGVVRCQEIAFSKIDEKWAKKR